MTHLRENCFKWNCLLTSSCYNCLLSGTVYWGATLRLFCERIVYSCCDSFAMIGIIYCLIDLFTNLELFTHLRLFCEDWNYLFSNLELFKCGSSATELFKWNCLLRSDSYCLLTCSCCDSYCLLTSLCWADSDEYSARLIALSIDQSLIVILMYFQSW